MKQIIWSSDALLDETAREYYQNFKREELDDDAYKVSDEEWSDEDVLFHQGRNSFLLLFCPVCQQVTREELD